MIDIQTREREIIAKLNIGAELSREEENYYFMKMASITERYEYVKMKKERERNEKNICV
jgi:hypothetical protein